MATYQIKKIPKFKGYFVDTNGDVWSSKKQIIKNINGKLINEIIFTDKKRKMKLQNRCGYNMVMLNRKSINVHRLVAQIFIPSPKNKPCVLHKDGNRKNNCISNLYWGTYRDNALDAIDHGTFQGLHNIGEKNGAFKYSDKQKQLWTLLVKKFKWQQMKICKLFGVSPGYLSTLINHKL